MEDISKKAPLMITPTDAPFYKALKKEKGSQVRHDWITDALGSNVVPSGVLYDAEPSYSTTDGRSRPYNWMQTFLEHWLVSRVSEIVSQRGGVAGVGSEVAHQIRKATELLGKKVERVLLSEQADRDDDDSNAALLGGFFHMVTTNVDDGGASDLAVYVTETKFQTALKTIYDAGCSNQVKVFCQTGFKSAVGTSFNGRTRVSENVDRNSKAINMVVDRYIPPVGPMVEIIPDRSMGAGIAIVDMEQCALVELAPLSVFRKDTDTRNRRGYVEQILTLKTGNETAHYAFRNDSTPLAAGS
jgi:hypothetical protein